jgi:hypothetical protein
MVVASVSVAAVTLEEMMTIMIIVAAAPTMMTRCTINCK